MAQLEEAEDEVKTTDNMLATLQTNILAEEAGVDNLENVDWLRNIAAKTNNNVETSATFKREIALKFNSIPDAEWKVYQNGLTRNVKDYAKAMIHLPIYFDQKFTLPQYGCLLGVKSGHHNVDIGMDKLVQLRIMKESLDNQGLTVYSLADTLRMHIR